MRRVGQARKRDANEPEIVEALEAIGVSVQRLNVPNFADLVCFRPREGLRLIEIKNRDGKHLISEGQRVAMIEWPIHVVETVNEALAIFNVYYAAPYPPLPKVS